jgi:hypothetical protein
VAALAGCAAAAAAAESARICRMMRSRRCWVASDAIGISARAHAPSRIARDAASSAAFLTGSGSCGGEPVAQDAVERSQHSYGRSATRVVANGDAADQALRLSITAI